MPSGLNGKSKWVALPLGLLIVIVGLLVTYGRSHGSESTTVQRNTEDIATNRNHIAEMNRVLVGVAEHVAVTMNDVKWVKDNLKKENENNE